MNSRQIASSVRKLLARSVQGVECTEVRKDPNILGSILYFRVPAVGAFKLTVHHVTDAEMRDEFRAQLDAKRIPERDRPSWIRR